MIDVSGWNITHLKDGDVVLVGIPEALSAVVRRQVERFLRDQSDRSGITFVGIPEPLKVTGILRAEEPKPEGFHPLYEKGQV